MRRRVGALVAPLLCALTLSGCIRQGVSTQAQDIHDLYVRIVLLATPVFVGVEAFLLWCIVRYRKRKGDNAPAPQDAGSPKMLGVFFAIPVVIIAMLFPFGEQTLSLVQKQDKHPSVTINVDAFQWEWTFNYVNEGLIESGKTLVRPAVMGVPIDETVHIHLQSRDVMHEFYVPSLNFMRNALPGHPNDFDFTPTKLGTYQAQCAEFCGLWHSKMTFSVLVMTRIDYVAWIGREQAAALNVTCPPGPPATTLVAQNTSWNTDCLGMPANAPLTFTVNNKDSIDHSLGVFDSIKRKVKYLDTGHIPSGTQSFTLQGLRPGRYYFECIIHGPAMAGTLIVR